ncbi:dienelactone hydrolase family protein [Tsuneonella mangrovi]|uniref:dienelactone hydrolase family protein n=1 Tax=Tsuneonella mangrovi TaxID=1982042 RepID=UPI000BA251B4|nr:dienelactone hydrolase family protein [Tsuneonella mangrovi]
MSELERIDYAHGETPLTGYIALPSGTPRAAVVVFPTIMNHAPNAMRRMPMLADAGYLAFMADFYGAPVPDRAAAFALGSALRNDVDHYRARIAAALDTFAMHPERGSLPMMAIGYCMGGQAVLEAARMGADLAMVASFHGILSSDRPVGADDTIRPRILVCHGDRDPLVPREQVAAFEEEMDAAGANWHLHVYSGVKHGFTDPESDSHNMEALGYNTSADRQSWAAMLSLMDEILG